MDEKTLSILEFPKILERVASQCAFLASAEKARQLRPTNELYAARLRQTETSEAVQLLVTHPDLTIGGARDVREQVDLAVHNGVLAPMELLDLRSTLIAGRTLRRTFEKLEFQFPHLFELIQQLPAPSGLIDLIGRAISEHGEILDTASEQLNTIRRELRIVHERLLTRLQRMVSDPKNAPYLQEALVTQRDGRYVLPLRAEFKGRIRSIVHDQSSSGATLFVEPLVVVELNNQYRELQLAERDEERRILTELSRQVAEHAAELLQVIEIIAELDLILARARYSVEIAGTKPELVSFPASRREGTSTSERTNPTIQLYQARHPLLDPQTVVPIDFELDPQTFALVITGPNTGGKTVALKTVGLLVLMAQAGLHIPTQSGSTLSIFENVYADIGDEQSIEQSLSTFSGHVNTIIRILEQASSSSLVILDELGAGTDPQEGSALARAILTHLVERRIPTLVTTHHPELKAFAHGTPGVVNASVEFDLETLRPTFRLTIGLPGRSNALAIAQRLGLPETIIAAARAEIHPDDLRADDLLDEIHNQRNLARQARETAEQVRLEAEALRLELLSRLDSIEDERRRVLEDVQKEAEEKLELINDELSAARRQLSRLRQPQEALKEVEESIETLQEIIDVPVTTQQPVFGPQLEKLEAQRRRSIRVGDHVRIRSLGAQGVVLALERTAAEVQVGILHMRTRLSDLELPSPSGATSSQSSKLASTSVPEAKLRPKSQKTEITLAPSPGMELDLRGQRADEAESALERYLDAAFLAGMPFVRIIHGRGTGRLREIVRQMLKDYPHVRSFEPGGDKEGGDGVTIVKFA